MTDISSPDPDLVRQRILDALHQLSVESQLAAFDAVQRGEVAIEPGPTAGELWVQLGDVTVVIDGTEHRGRDN